MFTKKKITFFFKGNPSIPVANSESESTKDRGKVHITQKYSLIPEKSKE